MCIAFEAHHLLSLLSISKILNLDCFLLFRYFVSSNVKHFHAEKYNKY